MEVKPVFMVLECTTVYPGTKKECIYELHGYLGTKNWRQWFGSYTRRKNGHDKCATAIYHDKSCRACSKKLE